MITRGITALTLTLLGLMNSSAITAAPQDIRHRPNDWYWDDE